MLKTPHTLCFTPHASHFTLHPSHLTPYTSRFTPMTLDIFSLPMYITIRAEACLNQAASRPEKLSDSNSFHKGLDNLQCGYSVLINPPNRPNKPDRPNEPNRPKKVLVCNPDKGKPRGKGNLLPKPKRDKGISAKKEKQTYLSQLCLCPLHKG